jgi:hypothetical protein
MVSTVKKSQPKTLAACWRRNCRQLVPCRCAAGGTPAASSTKRLASWRPTATSSRRPPLPRLGSLLTRRPCGVARPGHSSAFSLRLDHHRACRRRIDRVLAAEPQPLALVPLRPNNGRRRTRSGGSAACGASVSTGC